MVQNHYRCRFRISAIAMMNAILVAVVGYTNNLSAILLSIAAILLSASRVKSSARNLRKITRKIVAARILSRKMLARVKRPAISCARKLRKNLARGRPALENLKTALSTLRSFYNLST